MPPSQQEARQARRMEATLILRAIYKGIPNSYLSKYRREQWRQLQAATRGLALHNADLARFINQACGKFEGAVLAPYEREARQYLDMVLEWPEAHQQAILWSLREETALCIMKLHNLLDEEFEQRRGMAGFTTAAQEEESDDFSDRGD